MLWVIQYFLCFVFRLPWYPGLTAQAVERHPAELVVAAVAAAGDVGAAIAHIAGRRARWGGRSVGASSYYSVAASGQATGTGAWHYQAAMPSADRPGCSAAFGTSIVMTARSCGARHPVRTRLRILSYCCRWGRRDFAAAAAGTAQGGRGRGSWCWRAWAFRIACFGSLRQTLSG